IVDSAMPAIDAVRVEQADESRREVPADKYAETPNVRVTATVSDLALASLTLDGDAPTSGAVGPGRRTYVFDKKLPREGVTTWTLAATDSAGHHAETPVTIRGDWTKPDLRLDAPASDTPCDDVTAVVFAGRCSEARCRLVLRGLPGGAVRE